MVDVALKALSPGINDTTTAVMAIDHLTATLTTLAQRRMQPPHRFESWRTLVVGRGPTFTDIVADVFGQIRRSDPLPPPGTPL
jgi:uncharacterized membrane protein